MWCLSASSPTKAISPCSNLIPFIGKCHQLLKRLPLIHMWTHLLDKGHREGVPGDNAMVHELHEGGQCKREQVTKAKKKTRQQPLATSLPLTCTERTAKPQLYRAIASEKNQVLVQLKNRRTWSQSSWCSCPSEEQWMPESLAAVELHWQKSVVSCSSLFLGHYSYDGWTYKTIR